MINHLVEEFWVDLPEFVVPPPLDAEFLHLLVLQLLEMETKLEFLCFEHISHGSLLRLLIFEIDPRTFEFLLCLLLLLL